jgi:glycerol-3-phosphate cytidylyltransferase-like family protein
MTKLFKNTMVLSVPKEYIPKKDNPKQREKMRKHFVERIREVDKLLDDNPDCNIILDRFFFTELTY